MNFSNSFAIIISSCDAYSDAWDIFFKAFFFYWPDCPYKIYLISETKEYFDKRIIPIHILEQNWSRVIKEALREIPEKYILYMQEDYFLKKKISVQDIEYFLEILKREQAACIRLYPSPPPNEVYKHNKYTNIGALKKESQYRLSLQATLWDKEIFISLLVAGEDPWQAESNGSQRTNAYIQPFLSVKDPSYFDYICTGIIKRKWSYDALYFTQKHYMALPQTRELEPYSQYRRRKLSNLPIIGVLFKLYFRLKKHPIFLPNKPNNYNIKNTKNKEEN